MATLLTSAPLETQTSGARTFHNNARAGHGTIIADEMGLGKTLLALLAAFESAEARPATDWRPSLVVVKSACIDVWRDQLREHTSLTEGVDYVFVLPKTRSRKRKVTGAPVSNYAAPLKLLITTYEMVRDHLDDFDLAFPDYEARFDLLVVDEAHGVSSPKSRTLEALLRIRYENALLLTGTPVGNALKELVELLRLCRAALCDIDAIEQEAVANLPTLSDNAVRIINKYALRRRTTHETPMHVHVVDLPFDTDEERQVYTSVLDRTKDDMESKERARRSCAAMRGATAMRAAVLAPCLASTHTTPALTTHSTKLNAVVGKLAEIRAGTHADAKPGARSVIFSDIVKAFPVWRRRLEAEGYAVGQIDGRQSDAAYEANLADFRAGRTTVLLASLKKAGEGINLTCANFCFIVSLWWNPWANEQAKRRLYRRGQTLPVHVYIPVLKGTIERRVLRLWDKKYAIGSSVHASAEGTDATAVKQAEKTVATFVHEAVRDRSGLVTAEEDAVLRECQYVLPATRTLSDDVAQLGRGLDILAGHAMFAALRKSAAHTAADQILAIRIDGVGPALPPGPGYHVCAVDPACPPVRTLVAPLQKVYVLRGLTEALQPTARLLGYSLDCAPPALRTPALVFLAQRVLGVRAVCWGVDEDSFHCVGS